MEPREKQPSSREPPDNYAFNNLIQDFAEEINGNDVDDIKCRFKGIIPSDVRTGRQIVDYLLQNDYISEANIIYLQQIIRTLRRPSLLQRTIDFVKCNERRILHFRVTTTMLRTGFQAVKIHVEGRERLSHEDLERLRHEISRIVLVSSEDVCFAGIEETNSFVITFALPDMYCEALQMLLLNTKKHYHFFSLHKLGVDRIEVLGNWYEICESVKRFNGHEASEKIRNILTPSPETTKENSGRENSDVEFESKRFKNVRSTAAKKRASKSEVPDKRHKHNKKIKPITVDKGTSSQSTRPRTRSSYSEI